MSMMSGLTAKPLLLIWVERLAGREPSKNHVAVGQAIGHPHPKNGAVLLLARIANERLFALKMTIKRVINAG